MNNYLSLKEEEYCQSLVSEMENVQWAKPLIKKIKSKGISRDAKPLLFELRFAAELDGLQIYPKPKYEFQAGVGDTDVDFMVQAGDFQWLIELVCVEESDAVKAVTIKEGLFETMLLSSDNKDKRQSEEAEILLVQQKIGEKVYLRKKGRAVKFPPPSKNSFNVILVDMRGYRGDSASTDKFDYREIAFGEDGLDGKLSSHHWPDKEGQKRPIKGIFDKNNPLEAMKTVQERIHFIGFVNERKYGAGDMRAQIYFCANNLLFNEDEARGLFNKSPFVLRPE